MFRPDTIALTILMGALTALGPIATDMYLPALPMLARDMGADTAQAQLTLSAFLLGFIPGQILYGPVADRIGRRRVVLAGLGLFIAASLACMFAPDIETMIVARFIQAFGASGPIVLARSMARDLYSGPRAAQELARMGMILGFVPAIAPFFGGLVSASFGWQGVFALVLTAGFTLAAAAWWGLPETLSDAHRLAGRISLKAIGRDFRAIGREAAFRSYAAIVCMTFGGLFAFISGSAFVLQEVYGMTPISFGVAFGLCSFAYMGGTLASQKLTPRRGIERTMGLGCLLLAIGGLAQLLFVLIGFGHSAEVVIPELVFMTGVGLALPLAMSGVMMPFPGRAGTASSLMGILQMSTGAAIGIGVGATIDGSALPLAAVSAVTGLIAIVTYVSGRRLRAEALEAETAIAL